MLPEFGFYALIFAFCFALAQVVLPLIGAWRDKPYLMQSARMLAYAQCVFVAISFFALMYAFAVNDFSLVYVANNSNTHLPLLYRLCAVWGAHEGSMLLWLFILSIWAALVARFSRTLPLVMVARVLAVMAMIAVGFYLFLFTTSNPFVQYLFMTPQNGADLNPILQDPGLVIHPPILYMGYVGFSVVFAFAIAALMTGRLDADWARWSRPWTLVAWCFLTAGILLGSWWAYRELGWGGFWFWDPVENASLLPWLSASALLHSLIVCEKRDVFKAWTVLLAVTTFSLSLLGTFLVRSGVLISVHAFATDPKRGLYLLQFLMIVVGGSLALYAWRARRIINTGSFAIQSRETMLLLNTVLLFVAMCTVLLGTLYPLIIQALNLGKLSVGAPYFNRVFWPLMVPVMLFMGAAPYFQWQQAKLNTLWPRFLIFLIIASGLAVALPWFVGAKMHWIALMGLSLAFWIIISSVAQLKILKRVQWSMLFSHIGFAVTVIGVVLASSYSIERNLSMSLGGHVNLGAYTIALKHFNRVKGSNYWGIRATFDVDRDGKHVAELQPQLRNFPVSKVTVGKTAIDAGIFRDLYIALGRPLQGENWSVRIYYKPFVRWIWAGGLLMMLGGFLAVLRRRVK